jgi:PAS domain S-box-containing protein
MLGILGAWLFLAAGLCYLIETELPGKPLPLVTAAFVLVGLGALLGFAVNAEHRAADRRLRAELGKASNLLRSIEAVTDPGLAFLEIDALLPAVLARTKDAIGGDVVSVLLVDEDDSKLRVRASTGVTAFSPVGSEVRVGHGVLGTAAQLARPVVIADVRRGDLGDLPDSHKGVASLMAAPLIVHGTTLGMVEVASLKQRTFGKADLRLLQVVSDRLAAVVERARLDDLARRSRFGAEHASMHLRILARGGTVLGKALESYDTALGELADVVVPEFADWFGVDVLEASGKVRRVASRARAKTPDGHAFRRAGHPHPKGDELVRQAMAERRAQFVVSTSRLDPSELGATIHTPETLGEWPDVSSVLIVPVQVRGTVTAALSFVTGPDGRGFRPSDLETGKELAERVGVTIERVLSWRASQRAGEMASHYAERLRRLVDASLVVNAQFSEDEVLQLLVEHTHRALGADVAVVSGLPSGGVLAEKTWPLDRAVERAGKGDDVRDVVLEASDHVTRSGEAVRKPDERGGGVAPTPVAAEPVDDVASGSMAPVRGWVAAPITDGQGEVRRVVVAVGDVGTRFSFEDESVVTLLAQMASVALRNAGLYAEILGNEQRLQTLVDSSPLAIAELHATGEAEWWNRAAAELFGWPDRSVSRRIPVREGSELVLAGLLDSAFGGKPIIGVALPVTGADGEPRELSISASPLGAPGTVTGLLVVAEDVTERQRMLEQFYQAERLNAMSRMAGAVAHDFNNLLTVILGCSDVLMRRLSEDQELGPDVAAIQRAGTRAAALTNQLVRIGGQSQPVQPELVAVDEVIASMRPMLSSALGGNVQLEIAAGAGNTTALIDRSELERSVLNLAINARDAMPAGGTFTIQSTRVPVRRPGGGALLVLTFADTGIGMDEVTAAHCFEPFFTTKGRARGTGLGLAVVHAMVSQAGGDVRVESSPGAGARFTVTFPVVKARAGRRPSDARRDLSALAPDAGGETLLVVDDELEVLRLEVRELEEAGYEVLGAANASEALHLLNARGGGVDLLVTDVVMPGMNGIELATAVRWRYPEAGVLFVSGHLDDDATGRSPLPEQASLLKKPFGPDELTRRVREALNRSRGTASAGGADGAKALQGSKR